MIVWVIAGLLGLATGLRVGWALANEQSVVSTAMILALGSLGAVATLSWQPLTLLADSLFRWPNIAMGLSQIALIACAAGSCVMITSVTSRRPGAINRRLAVVQYAVAAVVAALSLVVFLAAGPQPQMSPTEYLHRNAGQPAGLLPLLYVLFALSLVAWSGLRHSSRSRRGRALFVFSVGITLILLAGVVVLLHGISRGHFALSGAGAVLFGCAMVAVAAGALLPTAEDWFGAGRELTVIGPLLAELGRRHPELNVGARSHGPRVFRVAEKMSLISDALFLEATAATEATEATPSHEAPSAIADVAPGAQASAIAGWIDAGRSGPGPGAAAFPGLAWLRQPQTYSDREWILAIAAQYRDLTRRRADVAG